MRFIKKILMVEGWTKDGQQYYRTHAIITDGKQDEEEAAAFGKGFTVGQRVELFFDDEWNTTKFRAYLPKKKT